MRVFAPNSNINIAVCVELTGLYDVSIGPLGQRVCAVEARLAGSERSAGTLARRQHPGDPETLWLKLGDLEDDHGFPLCYADMRRALLWIWLERRDELISNDRGMTQYERQERSFDAY